VSGLLSARSRRPPYREPGRTPHLSSAYPAGWLIARLEGVPAAEEALHCVAPVGEKDEYVARVLANITPYFADAMINT
jgi:hypothetical protein